MASLNREPTPKSQKRRRSGLRVQNGEIVDVLSLKTHLEHVEARTDQPTGSELHGRSGVYNVCSVALATQPCPSLLFIAQVSLFPSLQRQIR